MSNSKINIGLYPIVDSAHWVSELLQRNVKTIQLRIKDKPTSVIEECIRKSIVIANKHKAQLFINDYWQLAIKYKAFGVHLGQEDLLTADISTIRKSGMHLGISTHSKAEINKALCYYPSYIAFGPIYHTNTKKMPYKPQGLKKLRACCKQAPCPVVAIGGINPKRIRKVLDTGVDGVAVLSAIVNSDDLDLTMNALLNSHIGYHSC